MFSSTVRRALSTIPASPIVLTFTATAAPRISVSQYRPQRRYSSSKPPSPANGGKGVAEGQPAPTQPARSNRRKTKETINDCTVKGQNGASRTLPCVPSTQHLKSQDITASDFFSLHRPISVTEVWPRAISDEKFNSIFTEPHRKAKSAAVIGTLSNTIRGLDVAVQEQIPFESGVQSGFSENHNEAQHLDQPPITFSIPFPQHILKPTFMPFSPPPPPIPMSDAQALEAGYEAAEELSKPNHAKTYHALITVEESKDENGDVQYTSYASGLVPAQEEPAQPSFLDRMRTRQRRYEDALNRRSEENKMWAISVKRQRKLKMKKHKYKKLMRKTRNLRRRLDRT